MKKLLILFVLLYTFNANAANLTDTIGAECGRILFSLSEYDYPQYFDAINNRNKQYDYLIKCLKLYKENSGNMDILNKNYYRAHKLYKLSLIACEEEKDRKKKDDCKEVSKYNFKENLSSSSYDLYEKYSFIYENIDHSDEENINYKIAKRANDLTKEWFDTDIELIQNIISQPEENKTPPKKGIFSWFK